jgi:hypothetical protein
MRYIPDGEKRRGRDVEWARRADEDAEQELNEQFEGQEDTGNSKNNSILAWKEQGSTALNGARAALAGHQRSTSRKQAILSHRRLSEYLKKVPFATGKQSPWPCAAKATTRKPTKELRAIRRSKVPVGPVAGTLRATVQRKQRQSPTSSTDVPRRACGRPRCAREGHGHPV